MRIALCYPRSKEQARSYTIMPLGPLSLATYLKEKSNHQVKVFDTSFGYNSELKNIEEFKPNVLGLTVLLPFFDTAIRLSEYFKKKGIKVIWGGPAATNNPEESLSYCDFVVTGEGELSLLDLLNNFSKPSKVKGIAYKKDGRVIRTPTRELIEDINQLPIPDRDLLSTKIYYLRTRNMSLMVSRGCCYNCSFCQPTLRRLFGQKVRYKSPEKVVEEIELLHNKYRTNFVTFLDDTFTFNKEWLFKLYSLLKKKNLKMGFDILTRVDCFDEEIALILKKMGCQQIRFGVESGSQKMLNNLRKSQTVDQIKKAFAIAKKHKISTQAYIMLASPDETKESLRETEKLLREIKPDILDISITTPLPGTDLYEDCRDKNILNFQSKKQADFYEYQLNQLPIRNKNLTCQDVLDFKKRIIKSRRLRYILFHLKKELKNQLKQPSLSRVFYLVQEFMKRKAKG